MVTFDNKLVYHLESAFPARPVTSEIYLVFCFKKPMVPGALNCMQNLSSVFKMIL